MAVGAFVEEPNKKNATKSKPCDTISFWRKKKLKEMITKISEFMDDNQKRELIQ